MQCALRSSRWFLPTAALVSTLLALGATSCVSSLDEALSRGNEPTSASDDAGAGPDVTRADDDIVEADDDPADDDIDDDDVAEADDDDCTAGEPDCAEAPTCMPGSYVAIDQDGLSMCEGCPSGTFSEGVDASECAPWTECEPGQFVAARGNAASDQSCELCPEGQTTESANAGACHAEGSCPAGSVELAPSGGQDAAECEACEPGVFCAGGTSRPHACTEGTWDHDGDPATDCAEQTTCAAGQFVTEPGSATLDRSCDDCAAGSFGLEVNALECRTATECVAGTFVTSPGTATQDRTCQACPSGSFNTAANLDACVEWTPCEAGQIIETLGTATSDQVCKVCTEADECVPLGGCPAGTEQTAPADEDDVADCEPCITGEYCAGGMNAAANCSAGTWDHDADPATPCAAHTECLAGTFIDQAGSESTDRSCASCPTGSFSTAANALGCQPFQQCLEGTYVSAQGSATSDVECRGCVSGSYSDVVDAASCSVWTDCQPGNYVSSPGSTTADRGCAACPDGEYSASINAGSCVEVGQCPQGTIETAAATDTSPPECEPCAAGTHCAGGQAAAVSCSGGTWDDDLDPSTPCVDKTTCAAGQYVSASGSATANRVCSDCPAGQFSATTNANACTAWQTCAAGTYIGSLGTNASDRTCAACPAGQFSASTNSSSCTAWSTCASPSSYQASAPSATSDRGCAACTPPEKTSANNQTMCSVVRFQMSSGQVVMEAENYHAKVTNGSSDNWTRVNITGISNDASMAVGPEDGTTWMSNLTTTSPRMDYYVNFTTTGTFYVHVRGDGGDGGADSCWAGIDDTPIGSIFDFDETGGTWEWKTQSVTVSTTGTHTVSIWAREDGLFLDKIVVSTSSTPPTGNGPAQSAQN